MSTPRKDSMTDATAIRALIEVSAQWSEIETLSQFGAGYRSAMCDVLKAVMQTPAAKSGERNRKRKGGK